MKHKLIISLCALLVSSAAMAQEIEGSVSFLDKVKKIADGTSVQGVDTNYIQVPTRPWQVSIKSRVAQTDLKMNSSVNGAELFDGGSLMPLIMGVGDMAANPRIKTKVSTAMGVKVGYKGISIGYSFPVAGDKEQNFTFETTGNRYSVNLRWHKFKTEKARVHFTGAVKYRELADYDEETGDVSFTDWSDPISWSETYDDKFDSPVSIQTLIFDGFYIFNHRKFSYAAAYSQETVQIRSAGSPIAGIMGYYADFKYDNPRNAGLIYAMDNIGRLRHYQLGLGAGYAYNYVPAKGWLIHGMLMPMITVINRTKVNTYTSNFKEISHKHLLEWALSEDENIEYHDYADEYKIQSTGSHSHSNHLALNFTGRASVTYNWDRFFVSANGQFNNFNYKHYAMHGHLNDWYINAAVGVRF